MTYWCKVNLIKPKIQIFRIIKNSSKPQKAYIKCTSKPFKPTENQILNTINQCVILFTKKHKLPM